MNFNNESHGPRPDRAVALPGWVLLLVAVATLADAIRLTLLHAVKRAAVRSSRPLEAIFRVVRFFALCLRARRLRRMPVRGCEYRRRHYGGDREYGQNRFHVMSP